jgi:positive regulator of sigma E activity
MSEGTATWLCEARVTARTGDVIEITLERARCADCAGGCGITRLERRVDPTSDEPRIGDVVEFGVPVHALRASAVGLFGLPLAGMVLGACTVAPMLTGLGPTDVVAAGAAFIGASVGAGVGFAISRQARRTEATLVTRTRACADTDGEMLKNGARSALGPAPRNPTQYAIEQETP